jgi:hypothetical protein
MPAEGWRAALPRIKTEPGCFSLAGEGPNVGGDGGEAVTDDHPDDRTDRVRPRPG